MFDLKPLKIFNDKTIGDMFLPNGFEFNDNICFIPSIIHGRSIAVKEYDYSWILIKGGGWNYLNPLVCISKKDDELVYGLYSKSAGEREIKVSKRIEQISKNFPKALYIKSFSDYTLPDEFHCIKDIKFSNNEKVDPCLLYTRVKCPFRVADLIYYSDSEKNECIKYVCNYYGINKNEYLIKFAYDLGQNVSILHANNFINDTLEYSNVTLLAEIVDYELFTHPDIPFTNGNFELWKINERKEKEILYASEIIYQLSNLLKEGLSYKKCFDLFIESYRTINNEFVLKSVFLNKMINGENIII